MLNLNQEEKIALKKLAQKAIESFLKKQKIPQIPNLSLPCLSKKAGVFVTLKKKNQLRGCMGVVAPIYPLKEALIYASLQAAFNDPRFLPVSEKELKEISLEITILGPLKRIDDYHKIKLKEEGVLLKQGNFQALFLPQVAVETNWSLEEFLAHLCLKAGLSYSCFKDPHTEIYVFPAIII